jgi:hypothetical protein
MKPTSKVIKTFMINHEWTREGGSGQDGFECYNSEEENNYLIAHCEDGSIWKATQDILYVEEDDWECILEAPESETKKMVANFLLTEEGKIDYFLSNGWEIVSIQQNPNPCPYFIFLIRKYYEKQLTKKEIAIAKQKSSLYLDHWNKESSSFWEEVHKEADLEFLSEQEKLLTTNK